MDREGSGRDNQPILHPLTSSHKVPKERRKSLSAEAKKSSGQEGQQEYRGDLHRRSQVRLRSLPISFGNLSELPTVWPLQRHSGGVSRASALLVILMLLLTHSIQYSSGFTVEKSVEKSAPQFDTFHLDNHTVQLGAIAFLPCTIKNLGNKSVSWIRASDAHILTVDHEVFISDPRFSAIHQPNSSTWTLQIKSVQPEDAGKYECQVSTLPKMSHFLHLSVIVPNVKIFGDRDIFVKSSSTVQLRCVISQSLVAPTYIEWRHNDNHLPLATSALSIGIYKGARLQTTPPEHIAEGTTVSTLTILHAEMSDSGKYTCLPAQLESASVNLHVLETDLPALMQTSSAGGWREKSKAFLLSGLFGLSALLSWYAQH